MPNCQAKLVIAVDTLSLLFSIFINTTTYHLGRYKPSSPVSCSNPQNIYLFIDTVLSRNCRQLHPVLTRQNVMLNPELHGLRQIATTLRKYH